MIVAYFTVYISTVVVAAVTALCEVLWCSTRVRSVTYTSIFVFLLILAGPTVPVLNFFEDYGHGFPPRGVYRGGKLYITGNKFKHPGHSDIRLHLTAQVQYIHYRSYRVVRSQRIKLRIKNGRVRVKIISRLTAGNSQPAAGSLLFLTGGKTGPHPNFRMD
jgi:hypothetical protein